MTNTQAQLHYYEIPLYEPITVEERATSRQEAVTQALEHNPNCVIRQAEGLPVLWWFAVMLTIALFAAWAIADKRKHYDPQQR